MMQSLKLASRSVSKIQAVIVKSVEDNLKSGESGTLINELVPSNNNAFPLWSNRFAVGVAS